MTVTQRQARTPYERVSDVYARHTRECSRCSVYHGPPLEACESGERLRRRMAAFWVPATGPAEQQDAGATGRE